MPLRNLRNFARSAIANTAVYRRFPQEQSSTSTVSFDKEKFSAILNVKNYGQNDISVEVKDHTVTVEGKQEDKEGEENFVSRHFVKKYVLPKGYYDVNKLESKLSSDGVLTVSAPKMDFHVDVSRKIDVEPTGKPYLPSFRMK